MALIILLLISAWTYIQKCFI